MYITLQEIIHVNFFLKNVQLSLRIDFYFIFKHDLIIQDNYAIFEKFNFTRLYDVQKIQNVSIFRLNLSRRLHKLTAVEKLFLLTPVVYRIVMAASHINFMTHL